MPIVFLKIDFQKAFDSLRWDFIQLLFAKLGFGTIFGHILQAITQGSSSQVLVNGQRGVTFELTKVVRQGCPLSLLIFLLAMQALSSCIAFEQRVGRLQGVHLPHVHLQYIQAAFADDTHLTLRANMPNLLAAKFVLDQFGKASGLQIQWAKSEVRWLSPEPRQRTTDLLDWAWKDQHTSGQLVLGYSFIDGIHEDAIFASLVTKLQQRLQKWNKFHVSLNGKVIIANNLVASGLWYILTLLACDAKKLHRLQQMLVAFV